MNSYTVFCDNCSFKEIVKTNNDLKKFKLVKSASVQKKLPFMDYYYNKTQSSTDVELPQKVKCPKCGFATRLKLNREKDDNTNK